MIEDTDFFSIIRAVIRREKPDDGDRVGLWNVAALNYGIQLSRLEDCSEFLCKVHLEDSKDDSSITFNTHLYDLGHWIWMELAQDRV